MNIKNVLKTYVCMYVVCMYVSRNLLQSVKNDRVPNIEQQYMPIQITGVCHCKTKINKNTEKGLSNRLSPRKNIIKCICIRVSFFLFFVFCYAFDCLNMNLTSFK